MSKRLDRLYYSWWKEHYPECLLCLSQAEQFHHFAIVGSTKYAGARPRRSTVLNAAYICAEHHHEIHNSSEREVIKRYLGGEKGLYLAMSARWAEFFEYVAGG